MNKAILFGNLTRDPELRSLPSGAQVCSFGIATNRRVKKDEQWQDIPEFHNIAVFGRQAETCAQYLKKGSQALIEGRIQTRSYDKDGQKHYRTEVVAERVQFGGRGGAGGQGGGTSHSAAPAAPKASKSDDAIDYPEEDINPDDIPF